MFDWKLKIISSWQQWATVLIHLKYRFEYKLFFKILREVSRFYKNNFTVTLYFKRYKHVQSKKIQKTLLFSKICIYKSSNFESCTHLCRMQQSVRGWCVQCVQCELVSEDVYTGVHLVCTVEVRYWLQPQLWWQRRYWKHPNNNNLPRISDVNQIEAMTS